VKKYLYFEGVKSDAMWRPENSDSVLRPHAYLHKRNNYKIKNYER
jgi:hypothetical protein